MAVTAIVRIPLSAGMTREAATAAFEASAPRYRGIRGLVRKYYLFSEESPDRRRRLSVRLAGGRRAALRRRLEGQYPRALRRRPVN